MRKVTPDYGWKISWLKMNNKTKTAVERLLYSCYVFGILFYNPTASAP